MMDYLKQLFEKQDYDKDSFFLIAGPCVVEGETMLMKITEELLNITSRLKIPMILKASYKKANRTSLQSFTGIGDEKALKIIQQAGKRFSVPTVTDIHSENEAQMAAEYVDVLQIPAFLCRQTELLVAAAKTDKVINIKKGQFLSGESMQFAVQKVNDTGNNKVMLTDRGNTFGYRDLVVDFRNIPIMKKNNVPVVMDCTHSLQQPNMGNITGGDPTMIETIAKAAIAVGADGIFIETHPDPANAKSDGANMLPLKEMESLLTKLVELRKVVAKFK